MRESEYTADLASAKSRLLNTHVRLLKRKVATQAKALKALGAEDAALSTDTRETGVSEGGNSGLQHENAQLKVKNQGLEAEVARLKQQVAKLLHKDVPDPAADPHDHAAKLHSQASALRNRVKQASIRIM